MSTHVDKHQPQEPRKPLYEYVREFGMAPAGEGLKKNLYMRDLIEGPEGKDIPNVLLLEAILLGLLEYTEESDADDTFELKKYQTALAAFEEFKDVLTTAYYENTFPKAYLEYAKPILAAGMERFDDIIQILMEIRGEYEAILHHLQDVGHEGFAEETKRLDEDPDERRKLKNLREEERQRLIMDMQAHDYTNEEIEEKLSAFDACTNFDYGTTLGYANTKTKEVSNAIIILENMKELYQKTVIEKGLSSDGPALPG